MLPVVGGAAGRGKDRGAGGRGELIKQQTALSFSLTLLKLAVIAHRDSFFKHCVTNSAFVTKNIDTLKSKKSLSVSASTV